MTLRRAIAALALAGLGVAGYLTYAHYAHVAPVCATGGCETVQRSSYAELAGVPVALLGLVGYALLLGSSALRGANTALAAAGVAISGAAFSGYLLWAQLGPIGAVCQWCLGSDVLMASLVALCVARALRA
jgi:uncharacterized membrane protein